MTGTNPQAILQELSGDLMSPYCPGRTISSCPSKMARQLEDEILALAEQGKTREEIEAQLVERFGSDMIGYRPPPFLIGGTIVVAGIALIALVAVGRRWVRGRSSPERPSAQAQPSRAELDALDDALEEEDVF